ncbi:MAG: hypothetical protein UY31_C0068G0008 [Candidatus Wolfebacteria bacterium GW2011_GWE1_48_7]|uniref:NAD(P)-binding domain-containing protein n=2 Tax=Candidatus Wolfeibacteriota TaxID=1752735 RepID=A0A0G1U606_9BACT|nr:MAG: NmrA family protein [Candidatus Wolfebacteria bacterium GW2011_GWB1_47_1]KKU36692.1 MAG: hypothetical protein UX49_C0011G0030 [Candidatus Wolfebacteria bacterium GW2011_GWC2_46_275]KKU42344.1 MAG: hypothetical protein UX58_C0002G0058 [Candidatus Wolfebacteria bacterium GW2011_GWB2_46_69]KKU54310.1 MAG: hypothetical protein UX76_C0003G0006 [Candidatus Wolfebacteria bacterium GW2011_GWC1_47_103]KKU58894.1 MAG: hypothetical protein UX83_C0010G0016 [Candidatus Wolfebacteria bacterium GW2011
MNIAIIGARGCVGNALIKKLITASEHTVTASFRREEEPGMRHDQITWKRVNLYDDLGTEEFIEGADVVVYLVHSLAAKNFRDMDRVFADRTGRCAHRAGIKKIIYMGGIVPTGGRLSAHLKSRKETGEQLAKSGVPVAEVRASIILGACSVSYQMVYWLSKRLPVIIMPKWGVAKCSPIALEDVIDMIVALIERPITGHELFEIGREQMRYDELLIKSGMTTRGVANTIVRIPLFPIAIAAWGVRVITGVPWRIAAALIGSLKNDSVVTNDRFHEIVGRPPQAVDVTLKTLTRTMKKI